jgi:hypothetical protein
MNLGIEIGCKLNIVIKYKMAEIYTHQKICNNTKENENSLT